MPEHETDPDVIFFDREVARFDDPVPRFVPMFGDSALVPDHKEQLDRIEAKLDRLLKIVDPDRGLWVAPGPLEVVSSE